MNYPFQPVRSFNIFSYYPVWILILVTCLTGCRPGKPKDDKKDEDPLKNAIFVELEALQTGPMEATLKASSNFTAESQVQILSRTANLVARLMVEEGDQVAENDILAELENDVQMINFERAKNQYDRTLQEFNRQKKLYDQELISEQAYSDIQFELKQNEIAMKDAERELNYTRIRTPIAGSVTQRLIKVGEQISMNQPLFEVIDFDSIVAVIFVPERNLPMLQVGQDARLKAPSLNHVSFDGYVDRISPVVDERTGTIKVTLGLKKGPMNQAARPGLFLNVELVLKTLDQVLRIPKRALVYEGDQMYVFVADEKEGQRVARRQAVEVALADREFVMPEENSLLAPGVEVIVAGQTGLKDGALIRLTPVEPELDENDKQGRNRHQKNPDQ